MPYGELCRLHFEEWKDWYWEQFAEQEKGKRSLIDAQEWRQRFERFLAHIKGNLEDVSETSQDKYQQAIEEGKDYRPPQWPENSRTGSAVSSAYSRDCPGHPFGKNPGDVFQQEQGDGEGFRQEVIESMATRTPKQDKRYKTRDPERHINPTGGNPGDVIMAQNAPQRIGRDYKDPQKFKHQQEQWYQGKHEDNSLGKNPSDIVQAPNSANTGINNKEPYQQNNPHLARLKYGHDAGHIDGKNPGDVVKDFDRTKEKSEFSPPHRPARFRESDFQQDGNYPPHPEGSNPGDVVKGRGSDTEGRPLYPPHHHFRGEGWEANNPDMELHPLGANPGDVIKEKKFQHKIGAIQHREGMDSIVAPLHPLGHNPGDIACNTEEEQSPQNVGEDAPTDFLEFTTRPFPGLHFAVFPESICVNPILASSRPGDVVVDPFCGSGTILGVAKKLGRKAIGIDLVANYCEMSKKYVTNLETRTITCSKDGSEVVYTKDLTQHAKKSKPEKNDVCLGRIPFKVVESPCKECQRWKLDWGESDE
jgi:hypothetical protein